ncbi:Flp pilus assembly protein CpaB [Nocardioides mesophilus]|uniref:Flp pilus assembly protein CpaB n=1 Tax=Nocardioides mesophilus TaxID=433659 RepID=A0A7G9R7I5_9ACTN|nr:Flp pilus assembly protein CpaB [Nocardioides mesophilus]QNN51560.1 Flp pilus assembly protein CpaB [Nocardioides mesophilus]
MTLTPRPLPRLRRLRRALLARRRGLAAVCAGLAVLVAVQAQASPPPERVQVLVAAHDLGGGVPLRAADLATVPFPPERVPAGALTRAAAAVGRTAVGPVREGEPITDARLLASGLLDRHPGAVAVPVRIGDRDAVSLLHVGDHVDVLAADPQAREAAVTVASRAPVVALPAARSVDAGLQSGALVVLAVPRDVAARLAGLGVSQFLSVVLVR